ncbi:MAG TPA: threonylcarbamoyl-AMP synthase [Clostridiaceae bacterium]|nr:threonylcarbamoyl-AMP synthase [Clostridiaceae bacterium]
MINTEVIKLNPDFDSALILPAAEAIRSGELVAFPTETVYGLGANAFCETAIKKVFEVKGRPQDNPLIVHLSRLAHLTEIAINIPQIAYDLLDVFAPGPLTLILQKSDLIPEIVSAGLPTVAIRFPSDPIAQALIELAEVPIVAPSANLSGKPSPTQAWHVYQDLAGKIPYILDGGASDYGLESTIIDLSIADPVILRPGFITARDIKNVVGIDITEYQADQSGSKPDFQPKAPGQKYRHYSPRATVLILAENSNPTERLNNLLTGIEGFIRNKISDNNMKKDTTKEILVGLFLAEKLSKKLNLEYFKKYLYKSTCYNVGFKLESYNNQQGAAGAAHDLFNRFREFDRIRADLIICSAEQMDGAGIAYMNRLKKAADYEI